MGGEDITVHEFAHSLHLTGLAPVFSDFDRRLQALYYAARSSGVWGSGHYAMTDFKEYFAEGVQSFFGCNMADYHAPVTRDLLRRRDPNLSTSLLSIWGTISGRDHVRLGYTVLICCHVSCILLIYSHVSCILLIYHHVLCILLVQLHCCIWGTISGRDHVRLGYTILIYVMCH